MFAQHDKPGRGEIHQRWVKPIELAQGHKIRSVNLETRNKNDNLPGTEFYILERKNMGKPL